MVSSCFVMHYKGGAAYSLGIAEVGQPFHAIQEVCHTEIMAI
jgi:hypothetical protein